jgi:hypothetical protein
LRIKKEVKAISSLILVLIILCSVILGAFVSYMWVMANYYNMPKNTSLLVIEDLEFSVADFTNFNVTILNPSNSAIDVNITTILLRVETRNELYSVPQTEPAIPFILTRGTRQTFKCMINWSNMTGQVIRVEPIDATANASSRSFPYPLPYVNLEGTPVFDSSVSVDYFNLTLTNPSASTANLTISQIKISNDIVNVTTPSLFLPHLLQPNDTQVFTCYRNWDNLRGQNVTLTVTSAEGYELDLTAGPLLGAGLNIANVGFDYSDSTYFNLTIASSGDSTTRALVNAINLTQQDGTTLPITTRFPPLNTVFSSVGPNESVTFKCNWDWTQHHDENATINVYTSQNFMIRNDTVRTPPAIVWNMTDVSFDLNDLGHFTVNVTNTLISLNEVDITGILLNGNSTVIDPPFVVLSNGSQEMLNCTFDWTKLVGSTVNVTALAKDGSTVSQFVTLPVVDLKLIGDHFVYGDLRDQYPNVTVPLIIPYFNITVTYSKNSPIENVTITRITLQNSNETYEIDYNLTTPVLGPSGYTLKEGETITILCFWDWTRYLTPDHVKVTVYTAEGFQASKTW